MRTKKFPEKGVVKEKNDGWTKWFVQRNEKFSLSKTNEKNDLFEIVSTNLKTLSFFTEQSNFPKDL